MEMELGFPFSDGLVLQQGRDNLVWGCDAPGQRITLFVEGETEKFSVEGAADAEGRFTLVCPPLRAGGPYRMVVEGSRTVALPDVLSGEVWLASGQSNMEWSVGASDNADEEIERARDPWLRVLKVEPQTAWTPQQSAEGRWTLTHPDTASSFTAVGYYFARELRQRLGVPVGIIDCTWGGTPIAAWTSVAALRDLDATFEEQLAALRADLPRLPALKAGYEETLKTWQSGAFPIDPPLTGEERGFAEPDFDDGPWESMRLPAFWQNRGMNFNGVVWFRRSVELPPEWERRDLALSLGAIDDFDHTYVNGELVGSHPSGTASAFQIQRHYVVPARLLRPGKNLIAVRVFDHFGQGGFAGPLRKMRLSPVDETENFLPLSGEWRLFPEYPIPLVPGSVWATYPAPPLLLSPQHIPASLHHGMLAPVAPYGLRGFLWYQGESDVEGHAEYAQKQVALVRDLRDHFRAESLPFLLVELAGYRGGPSWPFLREAQQVASSEPFVGLVTARDIGDADDIHPRNKQEVGRRLALLARARVYGEAVEASGPVFDHHEIRGAHVCVWFHSESELRSRRSTGIFGFEVSGKDEVFQAADAEIEGDHVRVCSARVPEPLHVRYAFTDTGEGELENAAGLPALSFRTDGPQEARSVSPRAS